MSLRASQVDQMWDKLGYAIKNSGDIIATLHIDGKWVARTKRSHGAGKLDGKIPLLMRQQMHLNEEQFQRAYNCPMKREEYYDLLKSKGKV